tara:strand:+ start:851 stop:2101 length:1251 start_codon:yes stop_codon:yes gene_type:complete
MSLLINQKILNILFYQICFIPFLLVSGPFFPDLIVVLISITFVIFTIKENNLNLFKNYYVYFFLIFYILIIISATFSVDKYLSFKSVFFYFRFIIFFIAFKYIFEKFENSETIFFKFLLIISFILIIDSFIQYYFDYNILGMKKIFSEGHGDRVTGLFGKDEILGSYLSKILPILLAFYFFINKKKTNENFILLLLILFFLSIFISGERAAFIQMLMFTIMFFILVDFKNKKKYFAIFLTAGLVLMTILVLTDKNKKVRMIDSVYNNFKQGNIFSQYHQSHYMTGIKMFLDKPITGHGPKSFRVMCGNKKYMYNKYSCSTHPHNTYIQMLSEIGILGFLLILILFTYICFLLLKFFIHKLFKKQQIFDNSYVIILIGLFVYLWPISPNGNFFNNWLSILFFLQIATLYLFDDKKQQ